MKKQKFMYVVIVAITVLFFTSCERYETRTSLKENDIAQNVTWKSVVTDSIKKEMIRYFMIVGKSNRPEIPEVLIHKQFGIVNIPDAIVKDIPMYHSCFYAGYQMIAENNVHRTSGPTLWKAPQVTFMLKAMDPISFDQAKITIVTRDARIFWQVVLIFFFVLFGFLAFTLFNDDDDNLGWGIFLFIITIGMLVWTWFYVAYFVSGLCTLLLATAVVMQIVHMVRNKQK